MRKIRLLVNWQDRPKGEEFDMNSDDCAEMIRLGNAEYVLQSEMPTKEVVPPSSKRESRRKTQASIVVNEKKGVFPEEEGSSKGIFVPYKANAKRLQQVHPYFYDKNNLFWLWNFKSYCYETRDETDVLNFVDAVLGLHGSVANSKVKSGYLEGMRQVGRASPPPESPDNCIQFRETVVDTEGKVLPVVASPTFFFCNPIPWTIGLTSDTPVMDRLFEAWVGKEYVMTLYEILAYCCLPSTPIHVIVALLGSGGNGKDQFLKILERFVGANNVCSSSIREIEKNRFESYGLFRKLVCVMSETQHKVLEDTTMLKQLSGGSLIRFEKKHGSCFTSRFYGKLIIASNSLPPTDDKSVGLYRRWLVIRFPNEFEKVGRREVWKEVPDVEYECLARKVISILPTLLNRGFFTGQGTIAERQAKYELASNPLRGWFEACCVPGVGRSVLLSDLYAAFVHYLQVTRQRIVRRSVFSALLLEEGYQANRTRRKVGEELVGAQYVGVYSHDFWVDNLFLVVGVSAGEYNCCNKREKTCELCRVLSGKGLVSGGELSTLSTLSTSGFENPRRLSTLSTIFSTTALNPHCKEVGKGSKEDDVDFTTSSESVDKVDNLDIPKNPRVWVTELFAKNVSESGIAIPIPIDILIGGLVKECGLDLEMAEQFVESHLSSGDWLKPKPGCVVQLFLPESRGDSV